MIIILMAIANTCGITITKYGSSTQRVTIGQAKIIIIWLFFMLYPGAGHELFSSLELFGFVVLLSGVLIFNEIIHIKFLNLDFYTARALNERIEILEGDDLCKLITDDKDAENKPFESTQDELESNADY